MNRLKLNFELSTVDERSAFIQEYTQNWKYSPFTEDELEMMGNYILWGRNPDTGKNMVQEKEVQIFTRNSHWQTGHEEESLDALLETPTFNEGTIVQPKQTPFKIPREVFSRENAIAAAPVGTREILEDLFQRIDTLDLMINFYDLKTGKRINPPREELIRNFSEEEQERLKGLAEEWTQRKYLQNRHLLVELRREQYTIRDSYMPTIMRHTPRTNDMGEDLSITENMPVYPLGLFHETIFQGFRGLDPSKFSEKDLKLISNTIWDLPKERPQFYFDFCDTGCVQELLELYSDMKEEVQRNQSLHIPESTSKLTQTLEFYIENADLTAAQREILDMKVNKIHNEDIAGYINSKYGKSYTINYISTIYRQKIVSAITEAAQLHQDIMENIFYPENFKKCITCGAILLKDNRNFVKKVRSKDGLANRCKMCDKVDREKKKKVGKPIGEI